MSAPANNWLRTVAPAPAANSQDRGMGDDVVDQVGGRLRHPPRTARTGAPVGALSLPIGCVAATVAGARIAAPARWRWHRGRWRHGRPHGPPEWARTRRR